ncbi:cell death activator CIDE-3 isoform X2 [Rhinichthys klamathensis goyatoka]|uniref:cell death activator CIDE-3 isoform X2 n=1 Tax=Rhinichthys klamathensis goyatoka TaxID=3034132 RepID=UPI0024B5F828|nr:cell death activator CIDE-3 isoform X2 [Rhinichthys klamathensis goyatoka]
MDNAKKSLDVFSTSLSKCISICGSMTQQLLPRWTQHARPFRVIDSDRSIKKGIMASHLRDLRNKVMDAFHMHCVSALVLDEDGTGVDTEDFFQTLKDNTDLMVLGKGQKWAPQQKNTTKSDPGFGWTQMRKDVAKLTFDLYKNHPNDFIGSLNVQATLYGMYSVSYDLQCYKAKRMLREALRWTLFTMQTTGHVLVGTSCYIQHLIDEDEKAEAQMVTPTCVIKQLQH